MHTHNSFENLKPFVKWVGGKGSSVERLLQLIPEHIDTYVEPFVGSGALFFSLNFDKAIINDSNSELIRKSKRTSLNLRCSFLLLSMTNLYMKRSAHGIAKKIFLNDQELKEQQDSSI